MNDLSFKLDVFEGPLDVLLHLISKNKVDIREVSLAEICDQYIEYIARMEELDLEIAGEFLEMASRLLLIKSKILLPSLPSSPEDDEEIEELISMLEEYKKYKELSGKLKESYETFGKTVVKEPEHLSLKTKYDMRHKPEDLLFAMLKVLGKAPRGVLLKFDSFKEIVGKEPFPVREKISFILHTLTHKTRVFFTSLFSGVRDRSEMVAVFLAVLELIKTDEIRVSESEKKDLLLSVKKR
jgi:segregation and condensation protein A